MTEINRNSQFVKARETVFRLLKYRLRSEQEIREKLLRKEMDDNTVDAAVAHFKDLGLVNDRQFARKWILARLAKPFGANRIRVELKNKGICKEIIDEELAQAAGEVSEDDAIRPLIERQVEKNKNVHPLKRKQRIFQYLLRRGFSLPAVNKAIKPL
ncbi:MAG: regulatory protein RecX [Candidatus Omnitrophota bacterium]|nr:regulatory protein RecX [Candidatus Omnitrophota bacterium]